MKQSDKLRNEIIKLVKEYSSALDREKQMWVPGEGVVPPSGKVIGEKEYTNLVEASLDGWLTTGRFNDQFERKLKEYFDVNWAFTVNSGSSANLVAFMALTSPLLKKRAIQKGDEVIGVAAGFPTTVNPIVQAGAIPVFVDVDLQTCNIDVSLVEAAITEKTKAIMIAHTLGNPFNVQEIRKLCDKYNLWLVEDCCDAFGAMYDGKRVGAFGDIATLSFYPAHHITMGEGGAVLINNGNIKRAALSFRDWGRDCYCEPGEENSCGKRFEWEFGQLPAGYDHKYIYNHLGYNLKITDMQAACGLAQIEKIDDFVKKRISNFEYLYSKMEDLQEYLILPKATSNSEPSWFGFLITLRPDSNINRERLLNYLNDRKIGTRLMFSGNITRQPYMTNVDYRVSGELVNSDIVMKNSFWLGIYPGLSRDQLDFTASTLREGVAKQLNMISVV